MIHRLLCRLYFHAFGPWIDCGTYYETIDEWSHIKRICKCCGACEQRKAASVWDNRC